MLKKRKKHFFLCQTFSLSVLIWMALGMSFAVFSLVIEVTSFSRMVILKDRERLILYKPLIFNNTFDISMLPYAATLHFRRTVTFNIHWVKCVTYNNWYSWQVKTLSVTCILSTSIVYIIGNYVYRAGKAYSSFPAEYITVETKPIF